MSEFGRPRRARRRSGSRGRGRIPAAGRRSGRCPSGSRTASGCRPSRRPPAARWRRRPRSVLSEIAKVTVPPSPPLSVRAMTNRSMCRVVRQSRVVPDLLDRVEHRRRDRTPRSGAPSSPDTRSSSVAKSSCPVVVGELQVQPVAGLRCLVEVAQLVVEDHVLRRRRGVDVHDVGGLAARAPATAASPSPG